MGHGEDLYQCFAKASQHCQPLRSHRRHRTLKASAPRQLPLPPPPPTRLAPDCVFPGASRPSSARRRPLSAGSWNRGVAVLALPAPRATADDAASPSDGQVTSRPSSAQIAARPRSAGVTSTQEQATPRASRLEVGGASARTSRQEISEGKQRASRLQAHRNAASLADDVAALRRSTDTKRNSEIAPVSQPRHGDEIRLSAGQQQTAECEADTSESDAMHNQALRGSVVAAALTEAGTLEDAEAPDAVESASQREERRRKRIEGNLNRLLNDSERASRVISTSDRPGGGTAAEGGTSAQSSLSKSSMGDTSRRKQSARSSVTGWWASTHVVNKGRRTGSLLEVSPSKAQASPSRDMFTGWRKINTDSELHMKSGSMSSLDIAKLAGMMLESSPSAKKAVADGVTPESTSRRESSFRHVPSGSWRTSFGMTQGRFSSRTSAEPLALEEHSPALPRRLSADPAFSSSPIKAAPTQDPPRTMHENEEEDAQKDRGIICPVAETKSSIVNMPSAPSPSTRRTICIPALKRQQMEHKDRLAHNYKMARRVRRFDNRIKKLAREQAKDEHQQSSEFDEAATAVSDVQWAKEEVELGYKVSAWSSQKSPHVATSLSQSMGKWETSQAHNEYVVFELFGPPCTVTGIELTVGGSSANPRRCRMQYSESGAADAPWHDAWSFSVDAKTLSTSCRSKHQYGKAAKQFKEMLIDHCGDIEMVWQLLDANLDGNLSYSDLQQSLTRFERLCQTNNSTLSVADHDLQKVFRELDLTGSGIISLDSLLCEGDPPQPIATYWRLLVVENWGSPASVIINAPLRLYSTEKSDTRAVVKATDTRATYTFLEEIVTAFHPDKLHLSAEERMLRRVAHEYEMEVNKVEDIYKQFTIVDKSRNGLMERSEFEELLMTLHSVKDKADVPRTRWDFFWRQADQDTNGTLDFEEFLLWYTRHLKHSGLASSGAGLTAGLACSASATGVE